MVLKLVVLKVVVLKVVAFVVGGWGLRTITVSLIWGTVSGLNITGGGCGTGLMPVPL